VVYYDIDLGHLGPAPPLSRDRGMMLHAQISHWLIGQRGEVHIRTLSELHLSLPRTPDFLAAKLAAADSAEQIRQTEGGN
jgi:hypothetical protein